jgi:hypothetical protein
VFTIVLAGVPAYFIWKRMNPTGER